MVFYCPFGSRSTRSAMMLRWISDDAGGDRAAARVEHEMRPAAVVDGVRRAPPAAAPYGPSSASAVSSMRWYISLQKSFSIDPSGPGTPPRSARVRLR